MHSNIKILFWMMLLIILGIVITNIALGIIYTTTDNISLGSTGVFFIILAFACFTLEIFTSSFGLFTMGGIVSITIASIVLFNLQPWLILLIDLTIATVFYFVIDATIKAQQRKVTTGKEVTIGKTVVAKTQLNPRGLVSLDGELWTAISESGNIEPEEEAVVRQIDGIILRVIKRAKEESKID